MFGSLGDDVVWFRFALPNPNAGPEEIPRSTGHDDSPLLLGPWDCSLPKVFLLGTALNSKRALLVSFCILLDIECKKINNLLCHSYFHVKSWQYFPSVNSDDTYKRLEVCSIEGETLTLGWGPVRSTTWILLNHARIIVYHILWLLCQPL